MTTTHDELLGQIQTTTQLVSRLISAEKIPDALHAAVPKIAPAVAGVANQLAERVGSIAGSIEHAAIDPAIAAAISEASSIALATKSASHDVLSSELVSQIHAQGDSVLELLNGDGASLKTKMNTALSSIKSSVDSICDDHQFPRIALLDVLIKVSKDLEQHIPDTVYNVAAAHASPDHFELAATRTNQLANQSKLRAQSKEDDSSYNAVLAVGVMSMLSSTMALAESTVPMSVQVSLSGTLKGEVGVTVGWAAAIVAKLGLGLNTGPGIGRGVTVINLTSVLMTPPRVILDIVCLVIEGLLVKKLITR